MAVEVLSHTDLNFSREPTSVHFEGVEIQWEKTAWKFPTQTGETVAVDVYSIWNPNYWKDISNRLKDGQRCAIMMGGAYGVGRLFEDIEWQSSNDPRSEFRELEKIKVGRPEKNNFVALIHPDDQIEVIDVDRLPKSLKHLRDAGSRYNAYAWAQHNVYPVNMQRGIDLALIKEEDQTIACFWIREHWALEGLYSVMRKDRRHHGIFGGGSLNFHGEHPSYTSANLREQISLKPEWKQIDFVVKDELVESACINRSQPIVSFCTDPMTMLRRGSLSADRITSLTGYEIVETDRTKNASSETEYNDESNRLIDSRVFETQKKIKRFEELLS